MTIVSAKALAVMCEPGVNNVVFRAGEEEIALLVELDLGQGSFVSWSSFIDVIWKNCTE